MGMWVHDGDLGPAFGRWLARLVAVSEPHTSTSMQPAPDLEDGYEGWEPDVDWFDAMGPDDDDDDE